MGARVCVKGLVRGLLITGLAGFTLVTVSVYLYLLLVAFTLNFGFPVSMLINVPVGVLVVYTSAYFAHVGFDSLIALSEFKRRGLKGLETCARGR